MTLSRERVTEVFSDKLATHSVADMWYVPENSEAPRPKYLVDTCQIQTGGSASVYKAFNTEDGENYALKIFDENCSLDLFHAEVLSQSTPHSKEHTVPVLDAFLVKWNDGSVLVPRLAIKMSWFDPETTPNLERYLRQQPRIKESTSEFLVDNFKIVHLVAQSLAAAHEENIYHRDVKPSNILFDIENKIAMLGDWGNTNIASLYQSEKTVTLLYCAPEQISESPDHPTVDIYSLGLVTFELFYRVSLRNPLDEDLNLIKNILDEEYDLESLNRFKEHPDRIHYPNEDMLFSILQKAIAHKPTDRYQTVIDYTNDLINWHNTTKTEW